MKSLLLIVTAFFSAPLFASSEIRSSSGASCEQSDFQPWELSAGAGTGLYDNGNQYNNSGNIVNNDSGDETQVGMKVTYRFGGAEAINCNRFKSIVEREQEAHTTQLEIKVKQLEAQLKKQLLVNNVNSKVKFK